MDGLVILLNEAGIAISQLRSQLHAAQERIAELEAEKEKGTPEKK